MAPVGRYWIGTIAKDKWSPVLPDGVVWIKGQAERGSETGFLHWQVVLCMRSNSRRGSLTKLFGRDTHWELTRSDAANEYVWKDETAVPDTRFEFGKRPVKRNSVQDWDQIWDSAKSGRYDEIPRDILVRCYSQIRRITQDNLEPCAIEREVFVFWGRTGTGKSRRAWTEASLGAYPKDPRSKFWDGYRGQEHVVIDEFRGSIDIAHMLRWLDRYPVNVEIKGSSTVLVAKKIWITSNLDPRKWYPDVDQETVDALIRRLKITHFDSLVV